MIASPGLKRIALIGFSATGKSELAPFIAERLGWRAIDLDDEIERRAGISIPAIFERGGEREFRRLETEAIEAAAAIDGAVIATGGGAWLAGHNRRSLADGGFIVALEARPSTILARYAQAEQGRVEVRPLLQGADPRRRVESLKAQRQPFYALADCTIHTDDLSIDEVVGQILHAVHAGAPAALRSQARLHALAQGPGVPPPPVADYGRDVACVVDAGSARYPIYCAWGILDRLGEIFDNLALPSRVFLIADAALAESHAAVAAESLRRGGRDVAFLAVPSGEANKTLASLERLYDWLSANRAERSHPILALGGGVTTDLAGAAAATYLRGMPLLHAPTTVLGMVDAAIGGKVAVDLPSGKNLVGAFYQPRAVVADPAVLATLPPRELRAGYAEVIKHGFIRDAEMLDQLDADAGALLDPAAALGDDRARDLLVRTFTRNMAIKAAVVSADERESDLRAILNYGHTIGHAIETVTGYGQVLHGEAVAIGMTAAAAIAREIGLISPAVVDRQSALLRRFGLPLRTPLPLARDDLREAMSRDKKVAAGKQRWILLESIGQVVVRDDVPDDVVDRAIELVAGPL